MASKPEMAFHDSVGNQYCVVMEFVIVFDIVNAEVLPTLELKEKPKAL
jgi:hypothetical protein